jgi:hypothetical protein
VQIQHFQILLLTLFMAPAGLKGHAVTLYEAGKLGDSSVADMCEDLQKVEGTKMEGELQQFADHAFSLRHALECLRSGGIDLDAQQDENFTGNVSMDLDFGGFQLEPSSPVGHQLANSVKEDSLHPVETGAVDFDILSPISGPVEQDTKVITQLQNSPSLIDSFPVKEPLQPRKTTSRVDVIRMESLQDLAPATVQRVLRRDYDVVVSMIPLPSPPSVASPDGLGPVHFGPPSRAFISPWMKLLLYQTAGSGPISVALIKGQRFRFLPPPLAGCAKALVWTWDGTGVNAIGGKFEGTLVEGNILLHCVNSLLKHNAVLIQPFPKAYLDSGGKGKPVTRNIPLPLSESADSTTWHPHPSLIQAANVLTLQTLGYISLVQIPQLEASLQSQDQQLNKDVNWEWVPQSVEFGVPLFDTELCKSVCQGAIQSHLFERSSLLKHRKAMHDLRRKLQNFISDSQASGSKSPAYSGRELSAAAQSSVQDIQSEPKSNLLDDEDLSEVPLPSVNLLFDGTSLEPLHLDHCLQGRMPASLVFAASAATDSLRSLY